jgi:MFS family permease
VQRGASGAEGESTFDTSDALVAVALLSAGAGVIHATVIQEHLQEWWLYGTFFAVAAASQLIWAALALRRPTRSLLIWGALGNGVFVLLWVVTRITGLPVGPEPWTPESVGLIDVAASIFEVVLVVSAVLMLRRNTLPERTTVRLDRPQLAVFMGAVAAITYIAATGGGHH